DCFLPGMATAMALSDLARHGIRPPAWRERLGDVTPGRAWRYRDVFGDQEAVLVTFCYDDAEHGILIETATCPAPSVRMVYLSTTVAQLRNVLQQSADETGGQRAMEEITLQQARAALADAVWQPHRDAPPESLAFLPIVRRSAGGRMLRQPGQGAPLGRSSEGSNEPARHAGKETTRLRYAKRWRGPPMPAGRGQEHEELAMGRLGQVRQRVGDAYAARRAAVALAHDEGFGDGYAAASAAVAHDDGSRPSPIEVELPHGL